MYLITPLITYHLPSLCISQIWVMEQRTKNLLSTFTYAVMDIRPTPACK